jgi:methylmalonyl-CoA/ethylmalonyl-CoA epimerase
MTIEPILDTAVATGAQFVDHIAIAIPGGELEAQVGAYKLLGFREIHREDVLGRDQVREVLLQIGKSSNLIQLLAPLSPESPVNKTIERNGGRPGVAHLAFRVPDAQRAFDAMQSAGFQIIDKAPRPGSRGTTVFFVHPKSRADHPFGILLEMVEDPQQK